METQNVREKGERRKGRGAQKRRRELAAKAFHHGRQEKCKQRRDHSSMASTPLISPRPPPFTSKSLSLCKKGLKPTFERPIAQSDRARGAHKLRDARGCGFQVPNQSLNVTLKILGAAFKETSVCPRIQGNQRVLRHPRKPACATPTK